MTIAELYGKISSTGSNLHDQMEDLLTSDVFSACKYLRSSTLLLPFLSTATSIGGASTAELLPKDAKQAEYHFWPMLAHGEPDLVIVIKDSEEGVHLVVVEAKYFSGKSSVALDEEELETATAPADQLAGEYEDLLTLERQLALGIDGIRSRLLVYVTAHRNIRAAALEESMREIERFHPSLPAGPVYWTNWFALVPLLTQPIICEKWEHPIIDDLHDLMVRKGFISYKGFDLVNHTVELDHPVVYAIQGAKLGGAYEWNVPFSDPVSWYGSYHSVGSRRYFHGIMTPPIINTLNRTGASE